MDAKKYKKDSGTESIPAVYTQKGFSLVELLVAVALFSVVMVVSVGALLSLVHANRKAQALQSVISNLNVALDGMGRSMRMGSTYHCGGVGSYTSPRDCENGDTFLAFESFGGDPSDQTDQWIYEFDQNAGRIAKSEDGGTNSYYITAPEVVIEDMKFYVIGANEAPGLDPAQPRVVMVIKGTAGGTEAKTATTFYIQATASQRALDL